MKHLVGLAICAVATGAVMSCSSAGGPTVWTDAQGNRVPITDVTSYRGAEHCDWQSATFFTLAGTPGYVSDPEGVLDELVGGYEPDSALPLDAKDTGYRLDDSELWVAHDSSAAYLVTGHDTEQLAVLPQPFGCA